MSFIPTAVAAVVAWFKTDPKKVAHYVVLAIGYLTVADEVIKKAIEVLRAALTGLAQ